VIDACVRELLAVPAYYRTPLRLLYAAEAAVRVRAGVDRALSGELAAAIAGVRAAGELAPWIDAQALLRTLRAHLGATALEWASGRLADRDLAAAATYEACLTLLGVTTGRSHVELERAARAAQLPERRARGRARGRR